jgi:ubiquitin-conjugating enzyme E2 D
MALKRLQKENTLITTTRSTLFTAGPVADDLFEWHAMLVGPEGSPYADGLFAVELKFAANYPLVPPKVKFLTQIYHTSITPKGEICLPMIKTEWSPAIYISDILIQLSAMLAEPDGESPLMPAVANILKTDPEQFKATAREWTEKYAK